jgi:hypothetical protein
VKYFFLLIILISQDIFAVNNPQCATTVLGQANMPPETSQGSRKDCFIFAGVALIENFYCKDRAGGCSYNTQRNDRLSPLDANALTHHRQILNEGGGTIEVLKAIQYAGGLFKDQCAPFDVFLKNSNWGAKIQNALRIYQTPGVTPLKCRGVASELKNNLKLLTDVEPIMNGLSKKNFGVTVYDLVIPKSCEDERVKLKPFEPQVMREDDLEKIRDTILAQLSRAVPLSTDICGNPPSQKDCGPHSLVLSGVRKNCCAGLCNYEYQFYDSTKTFSKNEMTADNWVSEKIYFERLTRIRKFSTQRPDLRTDLIWIESKKALPK